jgi:orotidine-5'-phosphate decarboxylase
LPTSFADRLDAAVRRAGNPCLLGIDPHLELLPAEFAGAADADRELEERADLVSAFGRELVDVAAGRVAAVKPQSAFFEALGAPGVRAFGEVVAAARDAGLLVIGDVKRGDIGSTAAAYARAFLEPGAPLACDAITVNPYLGGDSLRPFLDACARAGAGLFVLVRTSNPGSADLQGLVTEGGASVHERVAALVDTWGSELVGTCGLSSVGAVVGATHPALLADLRARLPRAPLLLPGYGAQGAGAADVVGAFLDGEEPGRGALVAASRSVAFAYRSGAHAGLSWKDAARAALDDMAGELREALDPAARA